MDVESFIINFCKVNELDLDKIKSNYTNRAYNDYRTILIYLLRTKCKMKLKDISDVLCKKSHTSIIYSLTQHNNFMQMDKKYKELYLEVNEKI